ncbi:hypothetical protein BKA69DRAFT_1048274 [Paraphysoderma sedebokerense]|nr:hypothetical protein BKA69DRAFT_1048274 [Paraphysoderma sedebokerense]
MLPLLLSRLRLSLPNASAAHSLIPRRAKHTLRPFNITHQSSADSDDHDDLDGEVLDLESESFVEELMEEAKVEGIVECLDSSSSNANVPAAPTIASILSSISQSTQTTEAEDDSHGSSLISKDHPLLLDDFRSLPPFQPPNSTKTVFSPTIRVAKGEQIPVLNHDNFPYLIMGGNPLLPGGIGNDGLMVSLSSEASGEVATRFFEDVLERVSEEKEEEWETANGMLMTSVLRKRRAKMNKHKRRKLRKRNRGSNKK